MGIAGFRTIVLNISEHSINPAPITTCDTDNAQNFTHAL